MITLTQSADLVSVQSSMTVFGIRRLLVSSVSCSSSISSIRKSPPLEADRNSGRLAPERLVEYCATKTTADHGFRDYITSSKLNSNHKN